MILRKCTRVAWFRPTRDGAETNFQLLACYLSCMESKVSWNGNQPGWILSPRALVVFILEALDRFACDDNLTAKVYSDSEEEGNSSREDQTEMPGVPFSPLTDIA